MDYTGSKSPGSPLSGYEDPDEYEEQAIAGAPIRFVFDDPAGEQSQLQPSLPDGQDSPRPTTVPFKRWLSTLRKRNTQRKKAFESKAVVETLDVNFKTQTVLTQRPQSGRLYGLGQTASLSSSLGLVTAVQSATMTLASTSIAARSQRPSQSRLRNGSASETRMSTDSATPSLGPILDEKAWLRALQRQRILNELVSTEESYLGDLKALSNVYFTLLATVPTLTAQRRKSIQHSITQLVQLHSELLVELQQAVPNAEYAHDDAVPLWHKKAPVHKRWMSEERMPSYANLRANPRRYRNSIDAVVSAQRPMTADAGTVMKVAQVFDKFMGRFLTYEAYVAHNELMDRDAASTMKVIPSWRLYERGIEVLATTTASINGREANSHKGLTFADLLIKPVQHFLKYSLFFKNLEKETPACDDPVANAELGKVRQKLCETADEINRATDNPTTRQLIEISWRLQDRLIFQDTCGLAKQAVMRLLGHVLLCGALHVAYEGDDRVKGQYMICILYRSCLVLGVAAKESGKYTVMAVIPLLNGVVEAPDNGRGLQCHTAPYTWKLVFEFEYQQYEIIMSACSEKEEQVWKTELRSRVAAETLDFSEGRTTTTDLFCSISLNMKPLGAAFGYDRFARRMPVHRAATVGPNTNMHQVIIKNTEAQRHSDEPSEKGPLVTRSQSHLSSTHIPTLAPRRNERIRLETALTDVWSRHALPYPGIAVRRTENPINTVMRKLSMVSITSNFSKRSASYTSVSSRMDDAYPSQRYQQSHSSASSRYQRVDFHTDPAAFLPEDFTLNTLEKGGSTRKRRRQGIRTTGINDKSAISRPITPIGRCNGSLPEDMAIPSPVPTTPSLPRREGNTGLSSSSSRSDRTVLHHEQPLQSSSPLASTVGPMRGPTKSRSRLFRWLQS
ncbi:hypothetical protein EJ06DRAFT_575053 [Trichodelitschia bisporula]|uniref:DH domain-containing protein n=1 Tax=Trichodelitschia bisporula TaxID=703511 RepID=A0A6G1I0M5_9PEZI|nr:hypothetical protein EJ06DRAFT_575053 [Trichodelitschia bisporula]